MKRLYDSTENRQEDYKATVSAISSGAIVTISALYSFIAEKKLAGFFLPDVPVVGSYGSIAAGKAGKSSGSFNGKAGVTDNGKGKNRGAAASSTADATSL